jgi:hypothetical protein
MNDIERRKEREKRRKQQRKAKRRIANAPYDDFSNVCDPDKLYRAFRHARRGVSWKASVQRYEANLFKNIAEASRALKNGEDVRQGFVEFDIRERGKKRHIKSVHIKERVIQKCLCDEALTPILARTLIHDNGASRLGMGVHFALKRLITHLRRFYAANGRSNQGYALVIDFSRFFDSIRHKELLEYMAEQITSKRILALTASFITAFGSGVSIGLGSQVSQAAAPFYSNKIDHHIKERQRIRFFGRYMDDMYLLHESKPYLQQCLADITARCEAIGILINVKKTKIVKLCHGVPFLKGHYILTENGKIQRLPSGASTRTERRKLTRLKRLYDQGRLSAADVYASYQSWRGTFTRRFQAWRRVKRMDDYYNRLFIREAPRGRKSK